MALIYVQELKKKELDELDAIFSELGISVEEQAKRDAEAEKKRKKKEKKKAAAAAGGEAAANGSSSGEQQQQPAAVPAAAEEAAEQTEEDDGEALDPAAVSHVVRCGVVPDPAHPVCTSWVSLYQGVCVVGGR